MRTLHQTLHLQHHRHTGHRLHHKHTSYHGLAVILVLAGAFIGGLNLMAHAAADSSIADLEVTARIAAPVPSGPAIITDPLDGHVTMHSMLTVSGTCPVITPNVVVAIMDNGAMAGSAPCDDSHNFSVDIMLNPGSNALIARVYTITYDPGNDSSTVTVTYNTSSGGPITPPSGTGGSGGTGGSSSGGTASGNTGSSGSSSGSDTNSVTYTPPGTPGNGTGGSATLGITLDTPFIVFGPQLPADWRGSIFGGTLPYRVRVDWGDDATSRYTVTTSGKLDFNHRYRSMEAHVITISVSDADGQSLARQYAAVTPYAQTIAGSSALTPGAGSTSSTGGFPGGYTLVGLYGAYLLTLAAFGGFWIHSHHHFVYVKVPAGRSPVVRRRPARRHA